MRTTLPLGVLLPVLAWPCPKDDPPWTKAGTVEKGRLELHADKTSKLTQAGKTLFTYSGRAEQALFAAEDRYLALLEGDAVTLVTLDGMKSTQAKPLSLLTDEERRLVPTGECGPRWLSSWEETHYFLKLNVSQGGLRRPTEPEPPPVVLKLTWSGELKRVTPPPDLDPKSYALAYHSAVEPEARADAVIRAAHYAPGLAKAPRTADFLALLDEVVGKSDSSEPELRAVASSLPELPAADAMRLAQALLAKKSAVDADVLAALGRQATPESRALASKVFHEKDRAARTRAEAVRVATNGGAIANEALWLEALGDAAGEVREAAAEGLARHPPCAPKVFTALLTQQGKEEGPRANLLARAADACLAGDTRPTLITLLALEEHHPNRRLWSSAYLELAFWANSQGDAAEALRLIDEGVAARERSDTVTVARLLGLKLAIAHGKGDATLAADTLGELKELKDRDVPVCVAEGDALKKFWSSAPCEPMKKVTELMETKKRK